MYHISTEALIILFMFTGIIIGFVLRRIVGVCYTAVMFIGGMLIGKYYHRLGIIGEAINHVSQVNPDGIITIFIPLIIF